MSAYFVDALRNEIEEDADIRPFPNARDGGPARLTYAFMTKAPSWSPDFHGDPGDSFARYSSGERAVITRALAAFEAVANVEFTLTHRKADVSFGQFEMDDDTAGYAWNTIYEKETGDLWGYYDEAAGLPRRNEVWVDRDAAWSRFVATHEIGHVLGLKHPHQGDSRLPESEDTVANTVMSYDERFGEDTGLGLFDVIALQSIYGPAHSRRNDGTYVFGDDRLIWDGGGEDRITARDSEAAVSIDLRGGTWNHEGGKEKSLLREGQVFIGHFTEIEHAEGGRFKDRLIGNPLDNHLDGGDGADRLSGLGGADRLRGGEGADRLLGGTGRDTLSGAEGDDRLEGGKGADDLRGGAGADQFIFARPGDSAQSRRDTLFDFERGEGDVIDLGGLAAKGTALTFIGGVAFSGAAGEVRFDHRAPEGTRLVIDVDGDELPDFVLAFEGRITLREADFVL